MQQARQQLRSSHQDRSDQGGSACPGSLNLKPSARRVGGGVSARGSTLAGHLLDFVFQKSKSFHTSQGATEDRHLLPNTTLLTVTSAMPP